MASLVLGDRVWLERAEIGGDLADLLRRQVLRVLVHDLVGAGVRGEIIELLLNIAAVLPGKARDGAIPLRLVAMAGGAGRNLARRNALGEDLGAFRHVRSGIG